jgi:hypothetical protein
MATYRISKKLAHIVAWCTIMATASYAIEVIFEAQQWSVDSIQKVDFKIATNIAGL